VFGVFTRRSDRKNELERLYKEALEKYDRDMKDHEELRKEVANLKETLKTKTTPAN